MADGPTEHKTFPALFLKADAGQGIVEHIVAVMGNLDDGGDIIWPGAFTKTLAERGGRIRCLDHHNRVSITDVIGQPMEMREVGRESLPPEVLMRFPEASGGLLCKTQFLMQTPEGAGAFERIRAGAVDEWSIGFDIIGSDYTRQTVEGKQATVRNLRELRLWEYSPVIWGMNPATATVSAKGVDMDSKGVVPFQDLPLAAEDRAWDSAAAEGRVRDWAGGPNNVDWARYRRAFTWYDSEAPDTLGSYKLGIADVIGGTLTAVPRGVFAAAAALQGSRGDVDMSEADKDGCRRHLSRYYAKMDRTAPWDSKEMTPLGPQQRFGDMLVGLLRMQFSQLCDGFYIDGYLSREEWGLLASLCDSALGLIASGMPPTLADMAIGSPMPMGMGMFFAGLSADEVKEGRVLSAANERRLREALAQINDILNAAGVLTTDVEKGAGPPDSAPTQDLLAMVELGLADLETVEV